MKFRKQEDSTMFKPKAYLLLALSLMVTSSAALAAPLASSYKAIANITTLGPGTNSCPEGQIPVATSGNGMDLFGKFTLTEELCANPVTGAFNGQFEFRHDGNGSYCGNFSGTFVPSGQMLEVHATWRITHGTGAFEHAFGAGTAKGIATVVNGGPGPGTIVLDGSILIASS